MKSTAQLVMEYIDSIPIGDFVTRKNLIRYVCDNIVSKKEYETKYPYNKYSTIDNYRNVLVHNNILSMLDDYPGHYLKINHVPKNVSMTQLRDRMYDKPYYASNKIGLFAQYTDFVKQDGDL